MKQYHTLLQTTSKLSYLLILIISLSFSSCKKMDLVQGEQHPKITLEINQFDISGSLGTVLNDINDLGNTTGLFLDSSGMITGFFKDDNGVKHIIAPNSNATFAQTINNLNEIGGDFLDSSGIYKGFIWRDGNFEIFECPNRSLNLFITGANSQRQFVVNCRDTNDISIPILYEQGVFQELQYLNPDPNRLFFISDINNNGDRVGFTYEGGGFGGGGAGRKFLFAIDISDNEITYPVLETVDGENVVPQPMAISDDRTILGQYFFIDPNQSQLVDTNTPSGFLILNDKINILIAPDVLNPVPVGMNNKRVVVGYFEDSNGGRHGFWSQL